MYTCIYSRRQFESANREHILQNFLGARWESPEIVCDEVQQQFSTSIDKALETGLKEYRVLLGSEGGRGGGPRSLKVETTASRTVLVQSGGTAQLAEPRVVAVSGAPGSFQVEIPSTADAGWAAKKIRDLYPNIDAEQVRASLEAALKTPPQPTTDPADRLKLRLVVGGDEFFRGALKAVFNLLAVNDGTLALSPIFDSVREFILTGAGSSRSFVRWPVKGPEGLPRLGEFDHLIAVHSHGSNVDAFVQFFGVLHWTVRLTDAYAGPDCCHAYCVDPLRKVQPAEDRAPQVTSRNFPTFEEGREQQDDDVRSTERRRLSSFFLTISEGPTKCNSTMSWTSRSDALW